MIVDIFVPCFIDQLYPNTAFNMVKLLQKAGVSVNYNPEQTCCGQPAFNAGYWEMAKEVGEKFIREFPMDRPVVCPSASCVGMIKNYYPDLFDNTALHNEFKQLQRNVYEVSDFLVNVLKFTDFGAQLEGVATYHDSCAALREAKVKNEPRELLKHVKGLTLKEMNDTETCCGFGGLFSVKFEPIATGMAEVKVNNALQQNPDYLISTDLSCLMHLGGYIQKKKHTLKPMHIVDVLASGW